MACDAHAPQLQHASVSFPVPPIPRAARQTPSTYMSVQSGVYGPCGGVGFNQQALTTSSGPFFTEMYVQPVPNITCPPPQVTFSPNRSQPGSEERPQ